MKATIILPKAVREKCILSCHFKQSVNKEKWGVSVGCCGPKLDHREAEADERNCSYIILTKSQLASYEHVI